jgi:hypothetical protein
MSPLRDIFFLAKLRESRLKKSRKKTISRKIEARFHMWERKSRYLPALNASTVIAQFVARSSGYEVEGQTGVTGTYPTQCHHDGEVLSL